MSDDLGVLRREVEDGRDVLFGNHEDVSRRLGIDVLDGDASLVLMHLGRGDRPFDDLAEQAILVHRRAPSAGGFQFSAGNPGTLTKPTGPGQVSETMWRL